MGPSFTRYSVDYFVRVGLLKMLVAALDSQRRSTAPELITRRLAPLLYQSVGNDFSRAEELIRNSDNASWNFALTESNLRQILEWGRVAGVVGAGNQITERGLLLRHLMGHENVAAILNADPTTNPFTLSEAERLYLLYTQLECDGALYFLLRRLIKFSPEEVIRGKEANRLTCFAFFDLLNSFTSAHRSGNVLLTIKDLRELVGRMAAELDLTDEIPVRSVVKTRPTPVHKRKAGQVQAKRTKTADHESIPRFELLVDLGLLTKKVLPDDPNEAKARKSWRYWTTPQLVSFVNKMPESYRSDFCWAHFAHCASTLNSNGNNELDATQNTKEIAQRAYVAYLQVKRRFGHTPIESVAVMAMIEALSARQILEVRVVHELFLKFKRDNLFPETVHYAAGNDLEKMFIDIKPTFMAEVESYYEKG